MSENNNRNSDANSYQMGYEAGCLDIEKKYQKLLEPMKKCFCDYFERYIGGTGIDIERDLLIVVPIIFDEIVYEQGNLARTQPKLKSDLSKGIEILLQKKSSTESEKVAELRRALLNSDQNNEVCHNEIEKLIQVCNQMKSSIEFLTVENRKLQEESSTRLRIIRQLQDRVDEVSNSGQQIG